MSDVTALQVTQSHCWPSSGTPPWWALPHRFSTSSCIHMSRCYHNYSQLHNDWDIPMVATTSQVQHLVVLVLLMVVTDLDVTEVAAEYNVTAMVVEVSPANIHNYDL